jgi:hypothetical protein
MTIPASQIVSVVPNVLSSGGSALDLQGLCVTNSTRAPIGSIVSMPSQAAVAAYFGASSAEAALASNYFLGYDNSSVKPGGLLFWQYPTAPVGAYLRGGNVGAVLTLVQLQALSGTVIATIDGTLKTSTTINMSGVASFSAAAALIATALTATVTYDSVAGAFVVASGTTGVTSTMTYATGTISAALLLTQASGAVVSQGAIAGVPGTSMAAAVLQSTNWASFFTTFEPISSDKVLFAAWTNGTGNRYAYIMWDTASAGTVSGDTSSSAYLIKQATYSGTVPLYAPFANYAAALSGYIGALNFGQRNGRATMAFRTQSGLGATVTDAGTAANLLANGYNYVGLYATANQTFTFMYNGSITGPFAWIDSFVDQIWLNNQLQLALVTLLTGAGSVPYNADGYALIAAACNDPITAAVRFGAIRTGVTLSALQTAQVNSAAGVAIDAVLFQRGWYLQVLDPGAQVRGVRGTPNCTLWYMDGGSVQRINLTSVEVM